MGCLLDSKPALGGFYGIQNFLFQTKTHLAVDRHCLRLDRSRPGTCVMEGLAGVLPFTWRRVKKHRHRSLYQQMGKNDRSSDGPYMKKKGKKKGMSRAQGVARLGKGTWSLRLSKLRVSILKLPPLPSLRRLRNAYARMTCKVATGIAAPAPAPASFGSSSSFGSGPRSALYDSDAEFSNFGNFNKESGLRTEAGFVVR